MWTLIGVSVAYACSPSGYPDGDPAARAEAARCALEQGFPHAAIVAATSAADAPEAWTVLDLAADAVADDRAVLAVAEGRDRTALPAGVIARLDHAEAARAFAEGRYADAATAWQRVPATSSLFIDAQYGIGCASIATGAQKTAARALVAAWNSKVEPPRPNQLITATALAIGFIYLEHDGEKAIEFVDLVPNPIIAAPEQRFIRAIGALSAGDPALARREAQKLDGLPLHAWTAPGVLLLVDGVNAKAAGRKLDAWLARVGDHLADADAVLAAYDAGTPPTLPEGWYDDVTSDDRFTRAEIERELLAREHTLLGADTPSWVAEAVSAADAPVAARIDAAMVAALRDRRAVLEAARQKVQAWREAGERSPVTRDDVLMSWEQAHLGR